jgi:hypothetical protein
LLLWSAGEVAQETGWLAEYAAYDSAPLSKLPTDLLDPDTGDRLERDQWNRPAAEDGWRRFLDQTGPGREIRGTASVITERVETSYRWQLSLPSQDD